MITELFENIGTIVSHFATTLSGIFTSAIGIFYDSSESVITPLGVLMLLGLGTGLLIWGFKFVRKLIRVRTK